MTFQPYSIRFFGFLIIVVLLGGIGFLGCSDLLQSTPSAETVPQVEAATLKHLFPDTVGKGQPVVIDFYSQFCMGCQALSPKLEKAVQASPGVRLITMDIQKNDPQIKAASAALGVATVPYVLLINAEGKITSVLLEDVPQSEVTQAVNAIAPQPVADLKP